MSLVTSLMVIGAIAMVWYVVSSILIVVDLQRRGEKLNFLLIRMLLIAWVNRYKKLTLEATGHVGVLYYHWQTSVIIMMIAFVAAVAVKLSTR